MGRVFLKDCAAGDIVEDVFVITNKQLASASNGKPYIKAFISDKSGPMTARMWNASRDIFNSIPDAGFIRVRARIENYQGNSQAILEQIWAAKDGTFEVGDLMPHTAKDVGTMCRRITEMVASVQNRHLNALLQTYLDDEDLMRNLCRAPAAMNFHHAFIGGLLEHTLNAMEVADCVVKFYPGLNRDMVLAGIFLHDLAKTWELSYQTAFGYTDGGQLVGHIVKSAMWVEHKAKAAAEALGEAIPQDLIDHLQHIILAHHGLPEHGAARVPSTPEALFVHAIENLDAKMQMALEATRWNASGEGKWTEYMKAFGTKLYRPDACPADAGVMEVTGVGEEQGAPTLKLTLNNPLFETTGKKK
jgi:3'-5' exoribonuclease